MAIAPPLFAQTAASTVPKKLRFGIYLNAPYASETKEGYEGFCIDLWKVIAAELDEPYEFSPYQNLSDLLKDTSEGKVDVAVGNTSITEERLKSVDFSQPFIQGGMQIMIDERRGSTLEKLWMGLRDSGHLEIFSIGIGVILLGTLLLTLCERRWNKEFHPDWKNGLAESFYHVMSIAMLWKEHP